MATYRFLKPVRFMNARYKAGMTAELSDDVADYLLRRCDIERMPVSDPSLTIGEMLSVLPVVQVSPQTTAKPSRTGARRRAVSQKE